MAKRSVNNRYQDFNRQNLPALRGEIDTALREIGKRHAITFNLGRITFDTTSFGVRLEAKTSDADKTEFEKHAQEFGLHASDFGKTFVEGNRKFTIRGINLRSHNYPIGVTDEHGRQLGVRADVVAAALRSTAGTETVTGDVCNG